MNLKTGDMNFAEGKRLDFDGAEGFDCSGLVENEKAVV